MAHITLAPELPGILGPLAFRPETAAPLLGLAEVLLRGESTLTRGERELIAAYVSKRNGCVFCHTSHAAFAAAQLDDGWAVIDAVVADPSTAPVSPKMRAFLAIAAKVQVGGTHVTDDDVAAARAEGATDVVLIAAAFCMFNRYVDGLGTWAPVEREAYAESAAGIVTQGYLAH